MNFFETFEHGADIGIRGIGETPEKALSNLLKALASVMVEEDSFLSEIQTITLYVELEADYPDELLVSFVNKVISLSYSENCLLFEFDGNVNWGNGSIYSLRGYVKGVPLDYEKFGYGVEVKGATFTMAKFDREDNYYIAQCVIDV